MKRPTDSSELAKQNCVAPTRAGFGRPGTGKVNAKAFTIRRTIKLIVACLTLSAGYVHAILGQPGTLDPTWAGFVPGQVITPIGPDKDDANAVVVQSDGKAIVAGTCASSSGNQNFCVARYLTNGSLDGSFGSSGKVVTSVGTGDDYAYAAAVQSDGKILLAGSCSNAGSIDFCMVRYTSNGSSLDSSFGSNGKVFTGVSSGDDVARGIALQGDGKIVLAGRRDSQGQVVFCVARYNGDGSPDTSFDGNGKVLTSIGSEAEAFAVALQSSGKIILAGYCTNGGQKDFCLARYSGSGALDPSFDGNGVLATDFNGGNDTARAIVIQADGEIVVSGGCVVDASLPSRFCAARYHSDGSLDHSFAGSGKVATAVSGNDDAVHTDEVGAMTLQPDGKSLVVGRCTNGSYTNFCTIRFDGGPFGAQNCKLDIDGDGQVLANSDILIGTRVALGFTGNAVIGGIAFAANATRTTWSSIRQYLVTQCAMNL